MTIFIIIAIIAVIVLFFISTYNGLVQLRMRVKEAFSDMDVFLKKRYDLIPNLVETVKGYAKHEQDTLNQVISARNKAASASTPADKIEGEKELSGCLSRLFAVAESYPNLKADSQFTNLQQQLTAVETDIAQSRKYYNGVVKGYNTKIMTVPTNIIANMFGFKEEAFFEVGDESERQNVKVQF